MKGKPILEDVGWIMINMSVKGLSASRISDYMMVSVHQVYWILACHESNGVVVARHEVETCGLSCKLLVIGHYFCLYFLSIFDPTSLHIPYTTFFLYVYLCYALPLMSFMLTNRQQEHDLIGTTGHRMTCLLDY